MPQRSRRFREALATAPDDAGLRFNLALAAWRAGEDEVAERAAERVLVDGSAELAGRARALLGALRYGKARALEGEDLKGALGRRRARGRAFLGRGRGSGLQR